MNLRELKKLVNTDLSKYLITTQVLLGKFNMLDDAARNTVVCSDQSARSPVFVRLSSIK